MVVLSASTVRIASRWYLLSSPMDFQSARISIFSYSTNMLFFVFLIRSSDIQWRIHTSLRIRPTLGVTDWDMGRDTYDMDTFLSGDDVSISL